MEGIGGGLHPAVAGQSLGEGEMKAGFQLPCLSFTQQTWLHIWAVKWTLSVLGNCLFSITYPAGWMPLMLCECNSWIYDSCLLGSEVEFPIYVNILTLLISRWFAEACKYSWWLRTYVFLLCPHWWSGSVLLRCSWLSDQNYVGRECSMQKPRCQRQNRRFDHRLASVHCFNLCSYCCREYYQINCSREQNERKEFAG